MSFFEIIRDIYSRVTSYFRCGKCFKIGHGKHEHCAICNMTGHYESNHCLSHPDNGWWRDGDLYNAFLGDCPDCQEEELTYLADTEQREIEEFAELIAQRVVEKLNKK